MNARSLLQESLRTMSRYRLRSAFMMIGCVVGVAALTLVVSVGRGIERKVLRTVGQLFSASSIFLTSGSGMPLMGPRGDGARMTMADLEALAAALPLEAWDPMQVIDPAPVRYRDASATVRVLGQSERAETVWQRGLTRGEHFDAAAVGRSARVALIGATVERTLFAGEEPLGAEILVGGVPLRVIGLLEPMGTDAHGLDRDNEVVVPISTVMRRMMNADTVRGAKLLVRDPARVGETAREIARILRERHGLSPSQPDDFAIVTAADVQRMIAKGQRIFFLFIPLVAAVALLAGAAVAAGLMLLSVSSRTGEIGLRRAVGATPRHIALQFLLETAMTNFTGGLIGILLGASLALLAAARLGLPSFFSVSAALLGLGLSVVTGLAAGVLPARRAARMQPVDVLR